MATLAKDVMELTRLVSTRRTEAPVDTRKSALAENFSPPPKQLLPIEELLHQLRSHGVTIETDEEPTPSQLVSCQGYVPHIQDDATHDTIVEPGGRVVYVPRRAVPAQEGRNTVEVRK